jgi:hypothetical protein
MKKTFWLAMTVATLVGMILFSSILPGSQALAQGDATSTPYPPHPMDAALRGTINGVAGQWGSSGYPVQGGWTSYFLVYPENETNFPLDIDIYIYDSEHESEYLNAFTDCINAAGGNFTWVPDDTDYRGYRVWQAYGGGLFCLGNTEVADYYLEPENPQYYFLIEATWKDHPTPNVDEPWQEPEDDDPFWDRGKSVIDQALNSGLFPPPLPAPVLPPVGDDAPEEAPAEGVIIRVRVEAAGYQTITTEYYTDGFEPDYIGISGKITDASGNPIPNATVTLVDLGESATTDASGNYSLSVYTIGTQSWQEYLDWTLYPEGVTGPTLTVAPPPPGVTPSPSPTPGPADLSIENGVRIMQAIEGTNYVALRDIGILVRPYWKGSYPENIPTGYQFQITLTFDGVEFPPQTKGPGRDFTWVIPGGVIGASTHTVSVKAEIVGAQIVDSDPSNNTFDKTLTAYASRPLRLLYVRVKPKNAAPPSMVDFNKLAQESVSYLRQVYPVHAVRRVPGSYIVWTATDARYDVSLGVAKTLVRYNSERCLEFLTDGSTREKPNCDAPKADLAVAAIPYGYYGDMEGWLYGRGASIWGSWMDKAAQGVGWIASGGAKIDRAAITVVSNPINPAHEIGHYFNLNDEYGDGLGKRILYGFIWQDGRFIEIAGQKAEYYNFMGNAGVGWPATQYWVNADTWNHILNQIISNGRVELPRSVASLNFAPPSQTGTETLGPAFLVSGAINKDGLGRIDAVDQLHRYEVLPSDQGAWILEALDATGATLGLVRFDTYPTNLDDQVPFLVTLPVSDPATVVRIQLRTDSAIVATVDRSPTAPTVDVTQLPDVSEQTTTISWSAQDPDGDATTSTVYYSPDGGNTWSALVQDTTESQIQFDPATIPGGEVQFRIVTNDGFNETTTLLPPVTIPEHAPTAAIATPAGTDFIHGDAVILQGYADDPEDGTLPNENLHWFDGNNQEIGTGPLLFVQLPVGQHTLTLQAVDSAGQYGSASATVNVQPTPTPIPAGTTTISTGNLNVWMLVIFGLILLLIGGGFTFLILFFVLRRRNQQPAPRQRQATPQAAAGQPYQDAQGRWWYRDPQTGVQSYWNGQSWQAAQQAPAAPPPVMAAPPPQPYQQPVRYREPSYRSRYRGARYPKSGRGSCLIALLVSVLMLVLVFGGVSLITFQFIPGYSIPMKTGVVIKDILISFGGGALLGLLGLLALNGGFKAIITRRAVVDDEWGYRREKVGCAAVLSGIGTAGFGLLLLTAGLLLASLSVYQQILPWLGF